MKTRKCKGCYAQTAITDLAHGHCSGCRARHHRIKVAVIKRDAATLSDAYRALEFSPFYPLSTFERELVAGLYLDDAVSR